MPEIGGHQWWYKLRLRSNLTPVQRKILNEVSVIICPADIGKLWDFKKGEKKILRRLHRRKVDQLIVMGIDDWKEQGRCTVTGPVMASMALSNKVHRKNFLGRADVWQIDDPSYKIFQELTRIWIILMRRGVMYLGHISFQRVVG